MTLISMAPGQGAQRKGMGSTLFDAFPRLVEEADSLLGYSIRQLCEDDPDQRLADTTYTQPALYTVNALSYYAQLEKSGRPPDFAIGHSLGEYNALLIAEAFSFAEGLKLVKKRGELMGRLKDGGMLAVIGPAVNEIRWALDQAGIQTIDTANLNTPTQTILSGPKTDLDRVAEVFNRDGVRTVPLNVSAAFHSRYMSQMKSTFAAFIADVAFNPLMVPVISNYTARPYRDAEIASNLVQQLDHGVRWCESVQYLMKEESPVFEELGGQGILTRMVDEIRKTPG